MDQFGRLVSRTVFGSYLYGTNTDNSDRDFKEIRLPPTRDILLQRAFKVIHSTTKEDNSVKNGYEDVDTEVFSFQHFIKLMARGDTFALDMLFTPESKWLESSPIWENIQLHRPMLISKKSAGFVGYCRNQANKFGVKGSRLSAARAIVELLDRAIEKNGPAVNLSIVDEELKEFVADREHCELVSITMPGNVEIAHLSVCGRKAPYTFALKEVHKIFSNLLKEYGRRAQMAETNNGVDWKALMHAVRVGNQSIELFDTGHITFPRPEAEYLRAIKLGRVDYKKVAEEVEELIVRVEKSAETSKLPDDINMELLDSLVLTAYYQAVRL